MILFYFCLARLYVVIICDACIVLDGILGTQNICFCLLSLTEGTDVVVDSIADDVWGANDELIGALSDEFYNWD